MPESLRTLARARFEAHLATASRACPNGAFANARFVLVVDAYALRIVRDLYAKDELIELGVAVVDEIGTLRCSSDELDAIYFVRDIGEAPTLGAILADFCALRLSAIADDEKCACLARVLYCGMSDAAIAVKRYLRAHVFSLMPIGAGARAELEANAVLGSNELGPRALLTLEHVPALDFRSVNDSTFLLGSDGADDLRAAFPPDGRSPAWAAHTEALAAQLAAVVRTLHSGDAPGRGCRRCVRVSSTASGTARAVAVGVAAALGRSARLSGDCDVAAAGDPPASLRAATRIIVVDRSFDPVAPLAHASGFEAMVHDRVALEYCDTLPGVVLARRPTAWKSAEFVYDVDVRDASGARAEARAVPRASIVEPPLSAGAVAVGAAVSVRATVRTRLRPRGGGDVRFRVGERAVALSARALPTWSTIKSLSRHAVDPNTSRTQIMAHVQAVQVAATSLKDATARNATEMGPRVEGHTLLSDLRRVRELTEEWNALLPLCCAVGIAQQKDAAPSPWFDPLMRAILAKELQLLVGLAPRLEDGRDSVGGDGGSGGGGGGVGEWEPTTAAAAALARKAAPSATVDARRAALLVVASARHADNVAFFAEYCGAAWGRAEAAEGEGDVVWEALVRLVVLDTLTCLCWIGGAGSVRESAREWEILTAPYPEATAAWRGAMRLYQDRSSPFYLREATSGAIDVDRGAARLAALLDRSERALTAPEYVPRVAELLQCAVDRQPLDEFGVADVVVGGDSARAKGEVAAMDVILLVVGGITHSEMRCAAALATRYPDTTVTLGSTSLTNGCRYLHDLRAYGRTAAGAAAPGSK